MEPISEGRAGQPASAGAWLRNARQQRGLHIAALAVMLKVPQAKLEALEADRWDDLPDATFARALATAVCRALKAEPGPVLALLPRTHEREFDVRQGLNQPFREHGSPSDSRSLALLARPVVWGPLLLLGAAAAVYWIPAGWLPEREAAEATPVASTASGTVTATGAPVDFVPAPLVAASALPLPVLPAQVGASAPAPVPAPEASAPLQVRDVPPPPAATVPTAAAPAGQALRISASADTWVEVVDARGQALLSRLLRSGEQQDLAGMAPYKLRIGNVSGTRIEWRGAVVDLAPRSKDNVARLELN